MAHAYHHVGAYPPLEDTHESLKVSAELQGSETVSLLDEATSHDVDMRVGNNTSRSIAEQPRLPVVHHIALLEK